MREQQRTSGSMDRNSQQNGDGLSVEQKSRVKKLREGLVRMGSTIRTAGSSDFAFKGTTNLRQLLTTARHFRGKQKPRESETESEAPPEEHDDHVSLASSAEESDGDDGDEEPMEKVEKDSSGTVVRVQDRQGEFTYDANVTEDGRLELDFEMLEKAESVEPPLLEPRGTVSSELEEASAKLSGRTMHPSHGLQGSEVEKAIQLSAEVSQVLSDGTADHSLGSVPNMNIVILIVGTRGDIQPFVAIGRKMKEYGHRVRLASHVQYRPWVEAMGLEFYPLGGDPKILSEYVVKHRGILPTHVKTLRREVLEQHNQLKQICFSTIGACREPDPQHPECPFKADAIIANPPTIGAIECSEVMNVPLHEMFTMPWTPTKEFPHPMCRVNGIGVAEAVSSLAGAGTSENSRITALANQFSYNAVAEILWHGYADIIKKFRRSLGLPRKRTFSGAAHRYILENIPFTYIWSPSLVPKPKDWNDRVDVVGFVFLDQAKLMDYEPSESLASFLKAGPPPLYVGFGSLVIDNPVETTRILIDAIKNVGLRAIIHKGWGGLGKGAEDEDCEDILLLGEPVPHDWLFNHVSAVLHHGGAGTTAAGLIAGRPTFIVPFFGDQPFWGSACAKAGVGPQPCPIDRLSVDRVEDALTYMLRPRVIKNAQAMAGKMRQEDGVVGAVEAFHKHMPISAIVCKDLRITHPGHDARAAERRPSETGPPAPDAEAADADAGSMVVANSSAVADTGKEQPAAGTCGSRNLSRNLPEGAPQDERQQGEKALVVDQALTAAKNRVNAVKPPKLSGCQPCCLQQ